MKSAGLQICWIPYIVVAGVAHLGSCPIEGHYRAALFHSGEMLLADDFQLPARIIRTPEFNEIYTCYGLYHMMIVTVRLGINPYP